MSKAPNKLIKLLSYIYKSKAVWLRAIASLLVGVVVLIIAPESQFDYRFQIRGTQNFDSNIVLLYVNVNDLQKGFKQKDLNYWLYKEDKINLEQTYWDKKLWGDILKKLVDKDVKKIGVNFFFDEKIKYKNIPKIFRNKKIIWTAKKNSDGEIINPTFKSGQNTAYNQVNPDIDGTVRHLEQSLYNNSHISFKLSQKKDGSNSVNSYINYRGPSGTYPKITIDQVLNNKLPKDYLKDKIIIIGSETIKNHIFNTPLGKMNSNEILANIVDNNKNNRWITSLSFQLSVLYLIIILLISVWVMSYFPQSVALIYLLWLSAGFTSLSLALFDNLNFWIPTLAPLLQIIATYILFLSYQLTVKEYKNWRLEEEQKLFSQTQQLKNNFVSLISHDLKTPIAKMQGICDRILTSDPDNKFKTDVTTLRAETQELHRYIQSILQITKVESQDFKIHKEPSDINKIIEKVLSHLKFMLIDKSFTVATDFEPIFSIEVDSILIYEVVLNIIENSIKYSNGGEIQIKTYETDNYVHAIFKDNGPGISSDDIDHIFEKFYRAKDQKQTTKGSGLGLYLVKYFIQLHGGTININSEFGHGTEVHIKLPIEP